MYMQMRIIIAFFLFFCQGFATGFSVEKFHNLEANRFPSSQIYRVNKICTGFIDFSVRSLTLFFRITKNFEKMFLRLIIAFVEK